MDSSFNILLRTRENFLNIISGLPLEVVNKVPENFNNNLVWHLGHIIVTQQILCYQLAGVQPKIDTTLFDKYKKGTKPEGFVQEEEYNTLKAMAIPLAEQFIEDYKNGVFGTYKSYATSYGVELNSIEDAADFNAVHEGMHLGYAMALKRAALK